MSYTIYDYKNIKAILIISPVPTVLIKLLNKIQFWTNVKVILF